MKTWHSTRRPMPNSRALRANGAPTLPFRGPRSTASRSNWKRRPTASMPRARVRTAEPAGAIPGSTMQKSQDRPVPRLGRGRLIRGEWACGYMPCRNRRTLRRAPTEVCRSGESHRRQRAKESQTTDLTATTALMIRNVAHDASAVNE